VQAIRRALTIAVDPHERAAVITVPSLGRPEPVTIVVEPDPAEGARLVTDPLGREPVWCDSFARAMDEAIGEASRPLAERLALEVGLWREEWLPRRERVG
jgi:hypothetical protein